MLESENVLRFRIVTAKLYVFVMLVLRFYFTLPLSRKCSEAVVSGITKTQSLEVFGEICASYNHISNKNLWQHCFHCNAFVKECLEVVV